MNIGDKVKLSIAYKKELCRIINGSGSGIYHKHCIYGASDREWYKNIIVKYGRQIATLESLPRPNDPFVNLRFEDGECRFVRADGLVVVGSVNKRKDARDQNLIEAKKYWEQYWKEVVADNMIGQNLNGYADRRR